MAPPRTRYQRRITIPSRYSIRVYAALTAEAIWAWNRLHSTLFEMFTLFLEEEATAYAIWHMFQSDSNQRDMLLEVALAKLPPNSRELTKLKWLLKMANTYAPYRNAVVHVPLVFQPYKEGHPSDIYIDETGAREQARKRLELAGTSERFWNSFAGDLFVLGQYARGLIERLEANAEGESHLPLPSLQRPRLLCLQRLLEINQKLGRQASPPARPRQRRTSRR